MVHLPNHLFCMMDRLQRWKENPARHDNSFACGEQGACFLTHGTLLTSSELALSSDAEVRVEAGTLDEREDMSRQTSIV